MNKSSRLITGRCSTTVLCVTGVLLLLLLALKVYEAANLGFVVGGFAAIQATEGGRSQISSQSGAAHDILLGGLLASGFDEKSCISRTQSAFYRKASPHKPSPYLISKLRSYEDLHERCGPYTESYNRTVELIDSGNPTECKYVVWTPDGGLGNRILSMASAFLYALLTNRVLLIEQKQDLADLFCEPFPNVSWFLPVDFPVEFGKLNQNSENCYRKLVQNRIRNASTVWPPQSILYLHLKHDYNNYDQHFFCDEEQILLRQVPWLVTRSNNYFVPSFFLMPSFEQELLQLFPDQETVFHHLGRYLFHPSNQAWGLIMRFYQANLANAEKKIGLQIRIFNKNTPLQIVMDQMFSCIRMENLLPEIDTNGSIPVTFSSAQNPISKSVLVTSLYPQFYENLKSMYWTRSTVTGEVIGVHQPSHEENQKFGDNKHDMKAWAEMNLLSLCDVLVTSAWSTFGYVAQGLGGLKPWILYKPENEKIPNPACGLGMSMEPCFHSPPSFKCTTQVGDIGSLDSHVRHCEDREVGIKLFS